MQTAMPESSQAPAPASQAASVDHYRDEYWNDLPEIVAYLSRLATGDSALWWMDHLKHKYATTPFKRALIVGCGNGWVERELYDRQVALHFDAFDASESYLDSAEAQRGQRSIRYFRSDFSAFIPEGTYDLVVNVAALHHARHLYRMLDLLQQALRPRGLLVNWEYIGPNRNQYAPEHVALMQAINAALPERFRNRRPLVHDIQTFLRGDPTEAVHSEDIEKAFSQRFELLEHRPLNGGVAYQLLWNNVAPFRSGDPEARAVLRSLLMLDEALTAARLVPPLFWYSIGRPREGLPQPRALVDRWVREPLREFVADFTGGLYPRELLTAGHRRARLGMALSAVRQRLRSKS